MSARKMASAQESSGTNTSTEELKSKEAEITIPSAKSGNSVEGKPVSESEGDAGPIKASNGGIHSKSSAPTREDGGKPTAPRPVEADGVSTSAKVGDSGRPMSAMDDEKWRPLAIADYPDPEAAASTDHCDSDYNAFGLKPSYSGSRYSTYNYAFVNTWPLTGSRYFP